MTRTGLWAATGIVAALVLALLTTAGASVRSAADDAPDMPLPSVQLTWTSRGLAISGTVPGTTERQELVSHARRLYAPHRVEDLLEVTAVANPSWLQGAFLPDLRAAHQATATLTDATLDIAGVAGSALALARIAQSTREAVDAGVRVQNRLTLQRAP